MTGHVVADRYARALSEVIEEGSELDAALVQLDDFIAAHEAHPQLRSALGNPAIEADARRRVLDDLLSAMEITGPVSNLLRVLLKRGRLNALKNVRRSIAKIADSRMNRTTAKIRSAEALTSDQSERLQRGLSAYAGKTVRLDATVDDALGGGVVVELEGKILDGSLRTRLEQIKRAVLAEEG